MEILITVIIILIFTNFFSYKRGYNKCKSDILEINSRGSIRLSIGNSSSGASSYIILDYDEMPFGDPEIKGALFRVFDGGDGRQLRISAG